MPEISHAQLERYHYQALTNPNYRLEGMMDVIREEISMSMPYQTTFSSEEPPPTIKKTYVVDRKALEHEKRIAELEGAIKYLQAKLLDKKKERYAQYET